MQDDPRKFIFIKHFNNTCKNR